MRRLSSLGFRSLAHRKARSVLTGAGILLGVAILFGVLVASATTQRGFDDFIRSLSGRADVLASPVGSFDAKIPASSLNRLRALPHVRDVVGTYGFATALPAYRSPADSSRPATVAVSGIVPADALKVRNYPFVAGRFPAAGADEIDVTKDLARDLGLRVGDGIEVRGRKAAATLRIVGIVDVPNVSGGFSNVDGRIFTSYATALRLEGDPPGTYSGAAVLLEAGTDVDAWIDAHRSDVPGAELRNASEIAQGFKQFLSAFGTFLAFFAAITLFVGAFLIYLTLSMAVVERTRLYGTLRALGASQRQVRRVVVREALVLGVVATAAGLGVGLLLSLGLLRLISRLFDIKTSAPVVTPRAVLTSVVVGLAVVLVSAWLPARRAGRVEPVVAMRGDYAHEARLGRSWMVGGAIFLVSVTLAAVAGAASPAILGILLGSVLLVPAVLRPLASVLGRLTRSIARGVGEVAVLHLAKERSRSAYTLALIMVVMAMLLATGGLYLSVRDAIGKLVDRQFGSDITVEPRVPDDGTLAARLARVPGVRRETPFWLGFTTTKDPRTGSDDDIFVRTIDPASYFDVASFAYQQGDDATAKAALERGESLLVSDEVARRFHLKVGGTMTLSTTRGLHAFSIAATYSGTFGPPEVVMGARDARRYLSVGPPLGYQVDVAPNTSPGLVARRIASALGSLQPQVQTSASLKDQVRRQLGTYFQLVYAILLVAAVVGLLGLANTLAMSVLQRFREIGILRAIGVTRSQMWRMVLVESCTLALAAFTLALPLGGFLTVLVLHGTSSAFGFHVTTHYPWTWIPLVVAFALAIALVAAVAPGRRAARLEVVRALQYE